MNHYSIELVRVGSEPVVLGTAKDSETLEAWFEGAYRMNLLPDPPAYTDEIQVWEISQNRISSQWPDEKILRWVWRITWHQFEARKIQ